MRSDLRGRAFAGAALVALLLACGETMSSVGTDVGSPDSLVVEPVDLTTVRVQWGAVSGAGSYQLERRANLTGPFEVVAADIPALQSTWLDTGLAPETFYGYRLRARSSLGDLSESSVVVGARTPPVPGIVARTQTSAATPRATDADGYSVIIQGASDTVRLPIDPNAERRVTLPTGAYQVQLLGLAANCSADSLMRSRVVTDQGLTTLQEATFAVTCQDPGQGRLVVTVAVAADSLDEDGFSIDVLGIPDDQTIPVVSRSLTIAPEGNAGVAVDQLPAGSYSVELKGLAGHCTLSGTAARDVRIDPLTDTALRYDITCIGGGQSGRPYFWRNQWLPASASPGQPVELGVTLDMTFSPTQSVGAVQAEIGFDPAVIRYDSVLPDRLQNIVDNAGTPGKVVIGAFTTSAGGRVGSVRVARLFFTVIGTNGQTTRTQTRSVQASSSSNDGAVRFDTLIAVSEATLSIGGTSNQAPSAHANGPYNGTVGVPVSFSAAGSTDPDGSISTYAWSFSDGGSAAGSVPTHAFASAGSYTATLTVTDNLGSTGTAQASVTISGGGGGNLPPVAQANGPYSGNTGAAIAFSAAGSSDPDGSIASYAWSFGDGGTATGASPSHTYTTAGTYTVTLTVTDNLGSIATGQATVTVTDPAGSTPFTWGGSFGSINPADSMVAFTVTLNLSTDIVETPGAEALQSWAVDSLKWNPAVLRYHSFNFGPGGFGAVNPTFAVSQGRLEFSGSQPAGNSTGVILIATIRFKVIGTPGSSTVTSTALGNLIGTAGTGAYNYRSKTTIQEATLTAP